MAAVFYELRVRKNTDIKDHFYAVKIILPG